MKANGSPAGRELTAIADSQIYRDYESAFTQATGLPLSLHTPEMIKIVRYARGKQNPFCALMANANRSCASCYACQQKLEQEAQRQPKTVKCFAGLCETAVPVRVGENLVGFLHTGQRLLHHPEKAQFKRIAKMLLKSGAKIDLKRAEEAWFNTPMLAPKRYESLVRLLSLFAGQLASSANQITLRNEDATPLAVARARSYIAQNYRDSLGLSTVAKVVHMSANYFSEKFKHAVGINFADYVARTRVEKARDLLHDPNSRISEIAFDVGFHSLSQFNRAFKRVTGQSPRGYRLTLPSRAGVSFKSIPAFDDFLAPRMPIGIKRSADRMRSLSGTMRSAPVKSGGDLARDSQFSAYDSSRTDDA